MCLPLPVECYSYKNKPGKPAALVQIAGRYSWVHRPMLPILTYNVCHLRITDNNWR